MKTTSKTIVWHAVIIIRDLRSDFLGSFSHAHHHIKYVSKEKHYTLRQ